MIKTFYEYSLIPRCENGKWFVYKRHFTSWQEGGYFDTLDCVFETKNEAQRYCTSRMLNIDYCGRIVVYNQIGILI